MFTILKKEKNARRGRFVTPHGVIETPVFMNVGTSAAIKGAVSTDDLKQIKCQVELSNTYHLHVRPGDDVIRQLGGLHKFFNWDGPVLTDSGGFQVFSLAVLRKISEEGVLFASHMDGKRIFMGPRESMKIQSNLGSTIAMAFDECVANPAQYSYAKAACERTTRWLAICKEEMAKKITCALSYIALNSMDRVILYDIKNMDKPYRVTSGKRGYMELIKWVDNLDFSGSADLYEAVRKRKGNGTGLSIIISYFLYEDFRHFSHRPYAISRQTSPDCLHLYCNFSNYIRHSTLHNCSD